MPTFTAELYQWDGPTSWWFVDLPGALSDELEAEFGHRAAGFGSLRVEVAIGGSRWRTSVFPDKKRETFVLPVKKAVRTAEGLGAGSTVTVELRVLL